MAYNQQLSVLSQVAPATTGTAGQVLVSAGSSASSYWASAIPVSAYSAQFDGSSSYLTVPSNAAFQFGSNDFTIEAWIYTFSTTNQFITTEHNYGFTGSHYFWINASGYVTFTAYTSVSSYTASTSAITTNTWNHVSCGRTGSTIWVSLNGVRTTTSVSGVVSNPAQPFNIGRQTNGSLFFNGYISNLRVINGLAVYTGNFTPPTSPLGTSQTAGTNIAAVTPSQVSLLTCNGPGLVDSSPNAFTLTNTSGVASSQFAPFSSFSAIARSATQTQTILTSGSGTYYTPSGVAWLHIRMVGGGGGGGGSGASFGTGTTGANTIFGSAQAYGGVGGTNVSSAATGGVGGSGTIGSFSGIVINGGQGTTGGVGNGAYAGGGAGGSSAFGGAGSGALNGAAGAATTNSGSGGGGGGGNAAGAQVGVGGGSGGYVEAYISSPAASYAYTVGAGGGGGAAGTGALAGGGGGSGIIIIKEYY